MVPGGSCLGPEQALGVESQTVLASKRLVLDLPHRSCISFVLVKLHNIGSDWRCQLK